MTVPSRPRLARHVAARRHLVDGARLVVLLDRKGERSMRLGEREWALCAAMDGTRDADGLIAAAGHRGARIDAAEAAAFIEQLAEAELLDPDLDGTDAWARAAAGADDTLEKTPGDRRIEVLPGYTLRCDGSGTCCRIYGTVVFLPLDVARARAALPVVLDGGHDPDAVFTPASGALDVLSAVAMVDGRCAYLGPDRRCGIHAATGAASKPFGCRNYPLVFVDDGDTVRVVARPECACVSRSACEPAGPGSEPLVAVGVLLRSQLPEQTFVRRVPAEVLLTGDVRVPRAEVARWSREVAAAPVADAAAAFLALADAVGSGSLDAARDVALVTSPPPLDPARLERRLLVVRAAVERVLGEGWRSAADVAQQGLVALDTASDLLAAAPEVFAAGPRSERERMAEAMHLRAQLFGHLLIVDRDITLADALEERAMIVLLGRALGAVGELAELEDPAFAWPLSLTEALVRSHGLRMGTP